MLTLTNYCCEHYVTLISILPSQGIGAVLFYLLIHHTWTLINVSFTLCRWIYLCCSFICFFLLISLDSQGQTARSHLHPLCVLQPVFVFFLPAWMSLAKIRTHDIATAAMSFHTWLISSGQLEHFRNMMIVFCCCRDESAALVLRRELSCNHPPHHQLRLLNKVFTRVNVDGAALHTMRLSARDSSGSLCQYLHLRSCLLHLIIYMCWYRTFPKYIKLLFVCYYFLVTLVPLQMSLDSP